MRFARPDLLWILATVPLVALLLGLAIARRRQALAQLAEARLLDRLVTTARVEWRVARAVAACAALVFLIFSLARPQWGMSLDPVARRGVDVVIAVDISDSMLAEDVAPSRLEAAKSGAGRLIARLSGDRVGVVAFAGAAAKLCPLTLDHGAARLFVDAMSPDLLGDPGTALATAVEEILAAFPGKERRFKSAVLFSDGEDQTPGLQAALAEAAEAGLVIHTVGVGSTGGGPIPIRDERGLVRGYKQDPEGKVVTSRLVERSLAEVAEATGGLYLQATPGGGEIERIAESIGGMDQRELKQRLMTRFEERYQVPLALAILLLILEMLLPERRKPVAKALRPAAAVLLCLLLGTGGSLAAGAAGLLEEGNRAFQEGRYDEALKLYTQAQVEAPDAPEIHMSIGNVFYRQGDYEKAREAYSRAMAARRKNLSGSARYNSGTASLAAGNAQEAVEDLKSALRIDPEDAEARRNLELALRQLQQEQQQQQQQQQDQKNQQGQDQQQQQQGEDKQDPDQNQGQGQQGEEPPEDQQQEGRANEAREQKEKGEAERILDALKGEDKPRIDPGRKRKPPRRPERDW